MVVLEKTIMLIFSSIKTKKFHKTSSTETDILQTNPEAHKNMIILSTSVKEIKVVMLLENMVICWFGCLPMMMIPGFVFLYFLFYLKVVFKISLRVIYLIWVNL